MGLGSAMAGGNPADGREDDDFYPTPWEVTHALMLAEPFAGTIHECACGDGAMAREIAGFGHRVVATDLVDRGYGQVKDFLALKMRLADTVITNPPFDVAMPFIRHGLGVLGVRKMALVLKATFWHPKNRRELRALFPPKIVYPLSWRPDFLGKGRPTMDCIWCVWDRDYVGPTLYGEALPKPLKRATPLALAA